MSQHKKRLRRRNPDKFTVAKPTALSLLTHIVRATVLDGMLWPVIFSIVLASCLYYYNFAYRDSMTILMFTGIIAAGLVRGCNAWQSDLNDYQQQLAIARHRQPDPETRDIIPGYFPSRRY